MGEFSHVSVLLNEAIDGLNINPDGVYVDGTTGGGGHSLEIAKRLKNGKLICVDRDEDALRAASQRLSDFKNISFVHDNYKNLENILKREGIEKIDGCLFDLGVSSYQLDEKERGFSYMEDDAPLDMRMDTSKGVTGADILNTYDITELTRIFKEYGEEKFAKRIAERIAEKRESHPFTKTKDLNEVIFKCVPKSKTKGHPSKRVFQAVRIEVNEELSGLYEFFLELPQIMNENGRICVITFHSLEDRIVKQAFKKMANPCECPKEFPVCVCNKKPLGKPVNRKPILPSEEEIKGNSRSKSAKLRIFETVNEG